MSLTFREVWIIETADHLLLIAGFHTKAITYPEKKEKNYAPQLYFQIFIVFKFRFRNKRDDSS